MDLDQTNLVRPQDERPARLDGTCFYCGAPMGEPHQATCVIVSRSVVVKIVIEAVVSVPRDWTVELIEFSHNESSSCSDNVLTQLADWAERDDNACGCSCDAVQVAFLREATVEDHGMLPVLIDPEE